MAEEREKEETEGEEVVTKSKRPLLLVGSALSLVAMAYITSMVAVPKVPKQIGFAGPFVADLSTDLLQVHAVSDGTPGVRPRLAHQRG